MQRHSDLYYVSLECSKEILQLLQKKLNSKIGGKPL